MQHRKLLAQICQLMAVGLRNNAKEEYSSVMTSVVINPINQSSTLIRKGAVCFIKGVASLLLAYVLADAALAKAALV